MIGNLQEKLHQGEHKHQKVQKFVPVLDENLSVKITPKLSAIYLEDKIRNQDQNVWKTKSNKYKTF